MACHKSLRFPASLEQGLPAAAIAHVRENEKAQGTIHSFALANEIPEVDLSALIRVRRLFYFSLFCGHCVSTTPVIRTVPHLQLTV